MTAAVSRSPSRGTGDADATLIYDGECGFCTWWAAAIATRSSIEAVSFADLTDAQRHRLPPEFEDCVHLLTPTERYSCGAAAEAALARFDGVPAFLEAPGPIRRSAPYRRLRERTYRWVADHRGLLGRVVSKAER